MADETLPRQLAFVAYTAVSLWMAKGRCLVVNVAFPVLSRAMIARTTLPSFKMTLPCGIAVLGDFEATRKLNVTASPTFEVVTDDFMVVAVVALATCCGMLLETLP